MKLTVGTLLAIITLIGSILIGGSNFGSLRADATNNAINIIETKMELIRLKDNTREELRSTKVILANMSKKMAVIIEVLKRVEKRIDE